MSPTKLVGSVLIGLIVSGCAGGAVETTSISDRTSTGDAGAESLCVTREGSDPVVAGAEVQESTAGILFEPASVDMAILGRSETGSHLLGDATTPDVVGGGPTDVGAETVDEIAELSIADIEAFWSDHWESEYPTVFYESPAKACLYDSAASELPDTTCTEYSPDPRYWANNAFYCYGDRTISVDVQYAMSELSSSGDFAVVGTYAHEWGHHLQNLLLGQLGAADHPTFSIEAELQADCFAGVYARGAGSSDTFPVSQEDLSEAAESFYLSGTDPVYGWFEPSFHGTRQERYESFLHGYEQGEARACDSYAKYMLPQSHHTGPYSIGYLKGSSITTLASGGFEVVGEGDGDTRLQGNSYDLERMIGNVTTEEAFLAVLKSWAPSTTAADGIALIPVSDLEDFSESTQSWGISGDTWGYTYTQELDSESVHGYVIVNITENGTAALLLDVFASGPPPTSDAGWQPIVNGAVRALRSFQSST